MDTLLDTEEIVVKPLGSHLKSLREYTGATILGDGSLALILDPVGIASGRVVSVSGSSRALQVAQLTRGQTGDGDALLLFQLAEGLGCGAPMDLVVRVERLRPGSVETVGGRRTVRYRDTTLPFPSLSDAAPVPSPADSEEPAVVVCQVDQRTVGLLGALPAEVVASPTTVDGVTLKQKGIAGSALIGGRTVLLVDLHDLLAAAYREWGADRATEGGRRKAGETILLAEDSDFFRALVKRFPSEDGFAVVEAADGEAAWEILRTQGAKVRAVVTDIEMPRLDGLELTRRIRKDPQYAKLPVIGLTSLAAVDDMERGKQTGMDDYHIKLDRDRLVATLHKYLGSQP